MYVCLNIYTYEYINLYNILCIKHNTTQLKKNPVSAGSEDVCGFTR